MDQSTSSIELPLMEKKQIGFVQRGRTMKWLLAPNFNIISTFSSAAQPTTYTLNEAKTGKQIKVE
jgi:dipeptidyl-peptidase-4